MIILKDVDNVLSDFKIERHILLNQYKSTQMNLFLKVRSSTDAYNQHFHLLSIAQLEPPFLINQEIKDSDYYPIFWFAEYIYEPTSADMSSPSSKLPDYYQQNNNFFLTIEKDHNYPRVEEYLLDKILHQNTIKFEIFYKEKS